MRKIAWRAHLRKARPLVTRKIPPLIGTSQWGRLRGPLQSSVIPVSYVQSEAKYKKRVGVAYVGQLSGDIRLSGEFWRVILKDWEMESGCKKHRPLMGWEESFPDGTVVNNPPANTKDAGNRIQYLGWENPSKRRIAWSIPWTEESGELQFMGSQRVEHDRVTKQAHTRFWGMIRSPGTLYMAFVKRERHVI